MIIDEYTRRGLRIIKNGWEVVGVTLAIQRWSQYSISSLDIYEEIDEVRC